MDKRYDPEKKAFEDKKTREDMLKPVTLATSDPDAHCTHLFLMVDSTLRWIVSVQGSIWLNQLHGDRFVRGTLSDGKGAARATGCLRLNGNGNSMGNSEEDEH